MNRILEQARLIMAPVSIAVLLLAVVVLGWGFVKSVSFTVDLFSEDGWKRDVALPALLEAIDVLWYALAVAVVGALVVAYAQLSRSGH